MPRALWGALCAMLATAAACASPDMVLISADTLRPDFLGAYGCPMRISPSLDRLAGQSLVFDDALCDTPLTGPSFAAMMTSLPPRATGATQNGLPVRPDIPVVAELLRAAGYQTLCVQSTWTLKGRLCGLDRGFDVYDDHLPGKRWGVVLGERPADEVTTAALKLLEERNPQRPFFLWVHYIDPHAPYKTHKDFSPAGNIPHWKLPPRERVRARYASEVAFMDHHIGKLLQALPDDAVVLFVADHGESLYDHGYLGHGRHVYQDNLRIPLMIKSPALSPGRNNHPARGLDIAPTLLGLAGLPAAPGMRGGNLLQDTPKENTPRFFETYGGAVPRVPGLRALIAGNPTHQGVELNGWKYILQRDGGEELYRLTEDPGERANRLRREPETTAKLKALLRDWLDANAPAPPAPAGLTGEDLQALKSLGYTN